MKLFLIAFAVIAAVAADVSHLPTNEYLPPIQAQAPTNEYLPPVQQVQPYQAPVQQQVQYHVPAQQEIHFQAPVEAAPAHELADDGYRYKTNRRVVYRRNRRDVSHLPANEYLPPTQEVSQEHNAPVEQVHHVEQVQQVQYQAPVQQEVHFQAPVEQQVQYQAPVEAAPAHELADDGYHYKTHRRVVYRRNRRDVSHLPSNEYLPPTQAQAPTNEYLPPVQQVQQQVEYQAPVEAAPAHELADDGYHYRTNRRRVVYRRNRRDVSHLPSNEYLPPTQEVSQEYIAPVEQVHHVEHVQEVHYQAPVEQVQYQAPVEAAPAHELADDGYRYKTNRRVVYRRNRRDVSHLPSNEYLPPTQAQAPTNEYLPPVQQVQQQVEYQAPLEAPPAHELADDGYRYRTNRRRVVYRRNRRDVSHLPSNEYLPPTQEVSQEYIPPVQHVEQQVQHVQYQAPVEQVQYQAPVEAAPAHELAADGYRYKTQRRVVYRRH